MSASDGRAAGDPPLDPRAAHLIYLVRDGATLAEAGQAYGIGRERVRQILRAEGIEVSSLPDRREQRRSRRIANRRALAPAIEALWRQGLPNPEISKELGVPVKAVRQLIGERVPAEERARRGAELRRGARMPDESMIKALQEAARALGRTPGRAAYDGLRARGAMDGPSGDTIAYRWGGWAIACEAAGLTPNARPRHLGHATYSDDDYRAAVRRVSEFLGHPPTQAEYRAARLPGEPSVHAVNLRFGGWLNARREVLASPPAPTPTATPEEPKSRRLADRAIGAVLVWAGEPMWWQLSPGLAA